MAGRSIIIKDNTSKILSALKKLTGQEVLVGIPEAKNSRQKSGEPTNAGLGYIHEFGSPAQNIPARPFLIPGVRKSQRNVMPHLRAACNLALEGESAKAMHALNRAGLVAQNYVRREISTGDFVPLQPETVAHRYLARGTQSQRESEIRYMHMVNAGVTPAAAQAATGIRPLINTGQLRNAITYVVRKVK